MSHQNLADLRLAVYACIAEPRPHTLDEIAEILGVTRERVRQIESQAIKKLHRRISSMMKSDKIAVGDIIGCLKG